MATANVRNMRFRYTKLEDRIAWTQKFYPHALDFLNVVHYIPWREYREELDSEIEVAVEEGEHFVVNTNKEQQFTIERGISTAKQVPYSIFGGAACEILNSLFPEAGDLHKTTDPTADIDILLKAPLFTVSTLEGNNDYQYPLIVRDQHGERYTPLADHYTRWIFERVVEYIRPIAVKFDTDDDIIRTVKEDTEETNIADMEQQVGKLLVTRLKHDNMIKIQITARVGDYATHIVEFVMTTTGLEEPKEFDYSYSLHVNNYFITNPKWLLRQQVLAIRGRQELSQRGRYKLFNHYGRVYYLLQLIPYLVRNHIILRPGQTEFEVLRDAIRDGLFTNQIARSMPIWASLQNTINQLILRKMLTPIRQYLPPDNVFTNVFVNPQNQARGAAAAGGAERTTGRGSGGAAAAGGGGGAQGGGKRKTRKLQKKTTKTRRRKV